MPARPLRAARVCALLAPALATAAGALASTQVPTVLEQPGTQPLEAVLEGVQSCTSCHGGYDRAVEPLHLWRGSMMAQAARDPLFWAALAIAEQDFVPNEAAWAQLMPATTPERGGAGEFCLKCHSPAAWLAKRSTPSDGSALTGEDYLGVSCGSCHRFVDPATSEAQTMVQAGREPWWTNPKTSQTEAFYGNAQYVVDPDWQKRGPYDNTDSQHTSVATTFFRQGELCGTCHDISNPIVGELAPGSGRQDGVPLGTKVALSNPPYAYGTVERTYSEWRLSRWPATRTADFASLAADLRTPGGAPEWASHHAEYTSSSDPAFNPPRTYSCETCHMGAARGYGATLTSIERSDLPLHDLTGANTWAPAAISWLSAQGKLRGGALAAAEEAALADGVERARGTLRRAARLDARTSADSLSLVVRVTNLSGHKLPTGYPEGRRAWLNVRFYDAGGTLLAERGRYDSATAELTPDTRVYEARLGMSRAWAQTLVGLAWDPAMPLAFLPDGTVAATLGELASGAVGEPFETFHFVLNDTIVEDLRIPPWGFDAAAMSDRNAAPVPAGSYPTQPDGTLAYWDDASYLLPPGAIRADVFLYHQAASKPYIDFLRFANTTDGEGQDLHDAWLATGMSPPEEVAATGWVVTPCTAPPAPMGDLKAVKTPDVGLSWGSQPDTAYYRLYRYARADGGDSPVVTSTTAAALVDKPKPGTWFYDLRPGNSCGESVR